MIRDGSVLLLFRWIRKDEMRVWMIGVVMEV